MHKVLVIEDDPAIQLGLEEYLSSHGYKISKSSDGLLGYEIALKENPDLILLDINLPSLNGLQVCRKLRESNFNNPIIMLTSMTEQVDKIVGLEIGADDYITKPYDPRELLARIRAHLKYKDSEISSRASEVKNNQQSSLKRHLLVIMFSDMVGYSKKMNENEQRGLELLKIHNQIMKSTIQKFRGNIVEIIGDAFVASFESAIDGLMCSQNIQKEFRGYNSKGNNSDEISVRIGIHIGDVFEHEGKLKGDALNIAARIQQLAEPGGIYLSQNFYLTVKGKSETKFENLGSFELKNIKEKVNIYKVIN